jgi:hypothetical protein
VRRVLSPLVVLSAAMAAVLAPVSPSVAAIPTNLVVTVDSALGGPATAYPEDLWVGSDAQPDVPGTYDIRVNGAPYATGWSHSGYYGRRLAGTDAPAGELTVAVTFRPDDDAYEAATTTAVVARPKGARPPVDIGTPPPVVDYGGRWSLPASAGPDARLTSSDPTRCRVSADGRSVDFVHIHWCEITAQVPESANYLASPPVVQGFLPRRVPMDLAVTVDPPAPRVGDLVTVRARPSFQGELIEVIGLVHLEWGGADGPESITKQWPDAPVWEETVRLHRTDSLRILAAPFPTDQRLINVESTRTVAVGRGIQRVLADQPAMPSVGQSWTPTSNGDGAVTAAVVGTPGICQVTGARIDFTGVGTCQVEVSAAGTDSWEAAPAERRSIVVAGAPTTVALSTAPGTPKVGDTLTVTATVTATDGGAGTPTGSIRVESGGRTVERPLAGGSASFDLDLTSSGSRGVVATYLPSGSVWAGSSRATTVEVGRGLPSLTWTSAPPAAGVAGEGWRPRATATLGRPVTVEATGACGYVDLLVTYRRAGTCVVTARTAATVDHEAATLTAAIPVGPAPTSLIGAFAPASPAYGEQVTLQLDVRGRDTVLPGESLAGTLRIRVDGAPVQAHPVPSSGVATPFTLPARLPAGIHTVEAVYDPAGASSYAATTWSQSVTVTRAAQTVTMAPAPEQVRRGDRWRPEPTSSAGLPVTLDAVGACELVGDEVLLTRGGTCAVSARQPGDADHEPAAGVTRTFVVGATRSDVVLTVPALVKGVAAVLEARVVSPVDVPTGTVQFRAIRGGERTDLGAPVPLVAGEAAATWTPAAAGSVDVEVVFVPDDAGLHDGASANRTVAVARAAQAVVVGAAPVRPEVGTTWSPEVSGGASGRPVTLSVRGAEPACTLDGATVRFIAAGTCEIAFDQAGDPDHDAAPQVIRVVEVVRVPTSVSTSLSVGAPVVGQLVQVAVDVVGGAAGTVQLLAGGDAAGAEVEVADGRAVLPFVPTTSGEHALTVRFTPLDPVTYAGTEREVRVEVAPAATATALTVTADTLLAEVDVVAPGGGEPSGEVTFTVADEVVGVAPLIEGRALLPYDTAADADLAVEASYDGTPDHAASVASTVRVNPVLRAEVTSVAPPQAGWHRGPVTVTFTCSGGTAALVGPCPSPVVLSEEGVVEPFTRVVTTRDGGRAAVSVTGVRIDASAPEVRAIAARDGGAYKAVPRAPRCAAVDGLSGVTGCRASRRRIGASAYELTVSATDAAGNVATRTLRYTVARTWVVGARVVPVHDVRPGETLTLATVRNGAPAVRTPWDTRPQPWRAGERAGQSRWKALVRVPGDAQVGRTYVVRVGTGPDTDRVRLRVVS